MSAAGALYYIVHTTVHNFPSCKDEPLKDVLGCKSCDISSGTSLSFSHAKVGKIQHWLIIIKPKIILKDQSPLFKLFWNELNYAISITNCKWLVTLLVDKVYHIKQNFVVYVLFILLLPIFGQVGYTSYTFFSLIHSKYHKMWDLLVVKQ